MMAFSDSTLKEKDDREDSYFYGFCKDFENNAGQRQLCPGGELKYKEREFGTYVEGKQEWRGGQLRYCDIKGAGEGDKFGNRIWRIGAADE